ncbi:MAG: 4Fe-4S binding protein [Eggerthellaceae bacterium]|nr:4Fe-4S binding protein [Eggerthellaceae bacterium]
MPNRIAIDERWCVRPLGSTCERCRIVCPAQAISLDAGAVPRIDEALCTSCALCAGICDTFVATDILPLDVLSHAQSSAERAGDVCITCMEALPDDISEPAGNVIVLSCLAELSPEAWIALLAHRIPLSICCDADICASCAQAGARGYALWDYALRKARQITNGDVSYESSVPQRESLMRDLGGIDESDRRGIAEDIGTTLKDLASGERRKRTSTVVDDLITLQERMHARAFTLDTQTNTLKLKSAYKPRVIPPSFELIQRAVKADPDIASRIPLTIAKLDKAACACDDYPCARKCPTHALRTEFGTSEVSYDPMCCIGCGYCSAVCPAQAIKLSQTTAEIFS